MHGAAVLLIDCWYLLFVVLYCLLVVIDLVVVARMVYLKKTMSS
jgi:hypothetical protein